MVQVPADRDVFKLTLQVHETDIDELNHVSNIVYLRWVQDVSNAHWNTVSEELKVACKWVVLRHEIDYHSPALPGDTIDLLTWIDPPEGPRQNRRVMIQRANDGKILASAITSWCLLDPKSGRPKRVSAEICSVLGLKN